MNEHSTGVPAPHEGGSDFAGLAYAADHLSRIGRLDSLTSLWEHLARSYPTSESLRAWLESAQRMYQPDAAQNAWQALDALLARNGREEERIELSQKRQRFFHSDLGKVPRVAAVMDEFTTASFKPECVFLPLQPDIALKQLTNFKPDLVFIESAWHGNEGAWSRMVSTVSDELRDVLSWCRENDVPSVFWNKEDPVHFAGFLDAAGLCDYVFTTDMDCIPAYKDALGHDRVYFLPFAAQPQQHNPLATMDRKDAFNFAGSYYLRYPERQRDIAALLDTVREFRPVDIYDRNHGNDHPHYQFPEEYQSMILGRLPFSEIDKAYKGYRYGINMNTIKQSQTMFARRVYELMASNTVVVSNFSRGVRMLFGDLVICSDKREQLRAPLAELAKDDTRYRKFCLQALRKVMHEHTYSARLDYILSKVRGEAYEPILPGVAVVAHARSATEGRALVSAFQRQAHPEKHMFLLVSAGASAVKSTATITTFSDVETLRARLEEDILPFRALFHCDDFYGRNYLTDLVLASRYSDADGFGKACHYNADGQTAVLNAAGARYLPATVLPFRAAILRRSKFDDAQLDSALSDPATAELNGLSLLGIDEFNYCRNGRNAGAAIETVSDLEIASQGVSTKDLYAAAESLAPAKARIRPRAQPLPTLSAKAFFGGAVISKSMPLTKAMLGDDLVVTREDDNGKPSYLWMRSKYTRAALGLLEQSMLHFEMEHDLKQAHLVVEFYGKDNSKISHSMLGHGGGHALAIPRECTQLRFGLRISGTGKVVLKDITFGEDSAMPPAIIGPAQALVLTKQYPSYDDLYKYGFLHARVRAYRRAGVPVDVFRLNPVANKTYTEFENIDVASGDVALLRQTIETGKYKHVLVHMIDRTMWDALKPYLDNVKVTIWAHGAEIQHWQRRAYEFPTMSDSDIANKKKRTEAYMALWREIFGTTHKNLHTVFVSETLHQEGCQDVGAAPARDQHSVIHNYVSPEIFDYRPKPADQRMKILSVRPYSSVTYANDLTVAAILELAQKPFFKDLSFTLVGDGPLFQQVTEPLRKFVNVTLDNRFVQQAEIAELHKRHGVLLVPTRMDSQGVSRDEAMASGLVPVTNAVAAVPEFVDESCGFLAPAGDYLKLAEAIETLYHNPDRFLKMSAAASMRVRDTLGFDQTVAREIALIESGLSST